MTDKEKDKDDVVELDNVEEINESILSGSLGKINSINIGESDEFEQDIQQASNA